MNGQTLFVVFLQVFCQVVSGMYGVVLAYFAQAADVDVVLFCFLRVFFSVPCLLFLTFIFEREKVGKMWGEEGKGFPRPTVFELPYIAVLGTFTFAIKLLAFMYGVYLTNPNIAVIIVQGIPALTLFASWVFKIEKIPEGSKLWFSLFALLATLVGALVILLSSFFVDSDSPSQGKEEKVGEDEVGLFFFGVVLCIVNDICYCLFLCLGKLFVFLEGGEEEKRQEFSEGIFYEVGKVLSSMKFCLFLFGGSAVEMIGEEESEDEDDDVEMVEIESKDDDEDNNNHDDDAIKPNDSNDDEDNNNNNNAQDEENDEANTTTPTTKKKNRVAVCGRWAETPIFLSVYFNCVGSVALFFALVIRCLVDPEVCFEADWRALAFPVFYAVVFHNGIAVSLNLIGVKYLPSSVVSTFLPLQVVVSAVASAILLDEVFTLFQAFGAVLILAGLGAVLVLKLRNT